MSDFHPFQEAVKNQFAKMIKGGSQLYVTDMDPNILWEEYLNSFPPGTNEIYKERREYDCQCCKRFIKQIGNVVTVKGNKLVSIWDIPSEDMPNTFNVVSKVLSRLVKTSKIKDIFLSKETQIGVDKTHQDDESGVITWNHFHLALPSQYTQRNADSIASLKGKERDSVQVFRRSMEELTLDAGQTILELIEQGSLYKGDEFKPAIKKFIKYKQDYAKTIEAKRDNWCWETAASSGISRIRNSAIGTLLINLSEGMELDGAVGKFESVVAPTNYKRPKGIFTKRMIEQAQTKIEELGYTNSLTRRHASLDDITVQNVLFLHRDAKKKPANVFEEMKEDTPVSSKKLAKVEEVPIKKFVKDILPQCTAIKVLVENNHQNNLMNLIAPQDSEAPSMFNWDNNFSWSYNGDIADSMKQNVKSAGGKVDGVLRFSIQWNDGDNNQNDFDAHCLEPGGNLIYYANKNNRKTKGNLDVDVINPGKKVAVENITWPTKSKMEEGVYKFQVHNFSHNGGTTGFTAEIEYEGEIYSYSYDKELRRGEKILVAELKFSKTDGITFIKSLDSTLTKKEIWGIKTNSFVDVASITRSPNYWEEGNKSGNEHYFFFLNGCTNPNNPRGFYNEFLQNNLLEHKQVFEALGSKMRVEYSNNQLAGVGFSTTQRNSVVVQIEGSFTRTLKIKF